LTPLQFFAENQNIAGFDNPGKALYTTIRELVENGLDAAETISVLPEIDVSVEEMTADMFNERCGMALVSRIDEELYQAATPAGKKVRSQP
jgi:DNA topoisomerase VI subunit B